jgi:PiT family inorganic phosphate transporter
VVWYDPVKHKGVAFILIALLASPFLGFLFGYVLLVLATWTARRAAPRVGHKVFGFLQLGSASFMAFEHGKNDAQKVMGVLALALFVGGFLRDKNGAVITHIKDLYVPTWVVFSCAGAMAFGTAAGGWAVIRTIGSKLAKITTTEGFAAETGAGAVLEIAATLGVPVSTTHTLTGGIVGVGSAKGARAVKWGIGAKILYAWVFTLPMCFLFGGALSWFAVKTSPVVMVSVVAAVTVAMFAAPGIARRIARSRAASVPAGL